MKRKLLFKALLLLALVCTAQDAFSQTASATWALTANGTASTSGNITATSLAIGSSISNLAYNSPNGANSTGWTGGSQNANRYYEYRIAPTTGNVFSVSSISFDYNATGNDNTLTAAVYYYVGTTYSAANDIQLGTNLSVTGTFATFTSNTPIVVPSGQTLFIRVFGWNGSTTNPASRLYNRNMVISGSTCGSLGTMATNPADQNLCQGATLSLTTSVTNATSYEWYRDGVLINGQTSATYTKSDVTTADTGWYVVIGKNTCGQSTESAGTMVSVSPAPTVSASAVTPNICGGNSTLLNANATMPSGVANGANGTDIAIPDANTETGVISAITIPETCASATDITSVQVSCTHTWNADLDIYLMSPNGDFIVLSTDKGGNTDNFNATFVTGGAALPTGNNAINGNFAPQQAFSNLSGNATGEWLLFVYDDQAEDTGTLTSWSINLSNATCGNITYSWSPNATLTDDATATPTASPTVDTTYTVTATAGGCSTQATVQVTVTETAAGGYLDGGLESCGATTGTLTLMDYSGTIVRWESSLDNFATAPDAIANTNATYNFSGLSQTTYFRVVVANGSCEALSDVIEVTPGSMTTWDGSSWSNGVPSASTSAIFAGNYSEADHLRACNVLVTNNSDVIIPSGFSIEVNGTLTVESGSTFSLENNANLLQNSDAENTSPITVFRNSSALMRNDYTLWSSPVMGQGLLAFSPLTVTSPTTRFYTYTTATNLYTQVANISTAGFEATNGYLIRMPNNHPTTPTVWQGEFNGIPHNGTYTHTMTNAGVGQSFNLVGNPYPSPIDMTTFVMDNSAAITGTLYFWRKTNNAVSPSYCSWTAGTFVDNGEDQVFDPQGVIRTGQGFFVEALPGQTELTFNNTQRYDDNADQFFRPAEIQKDRIWLNLTTAAGNFSQTAIVYVDGGNSEGVDMFDGRYINDGAIRLVQKIEGVDYAVQGRGPFVSTDVVPLSFTANVSGNYTIAIGHVDGLFEGEQPIYLKDNVAGVTHDIKAAEYTFASEAGTFDGRFEMVYQNALANHTVDLSENAVVAYKSNGVIVVNAGTVTLDNVQAYDLRGRLIAQRKGINDTATTLDCGDSDQVVILKVTDLKGNTVNKKVLN